MHWMSPTGVMARRGFPRYLTSKPSSIEHLVGLELHGTFFEKALLERMPLVLSFSQHLLR